MDATGWCPSKDQVDRYGHEIPDEEYETKDFEHIIALKVQTQAIAKHLSDFMRRTDRWAKTIVFCVNQKHALEMRKALINLNKDLAAKYPNFVAGVTSDEGNIGR